MGKLLWAIIKDGLKALVFWLVASMAKVFLWGYTERMLSLGLGLIFVLSFMAVNLKRIVASLPSTRLMADSPAYLAGPARPITVA